MPRPRQSVTLPSPFVSTERAWSVASTDLGFDLDLSPEDDPDAGFFYIAPSSIDPLVDPDGFETAA